MGVCPVYIGDTETDCPCVDARHWALEPLHELSLGFYGFLFMLMGLMGVDPPGWPIRITGRLSDPKVVEVHE